MTTAGSPATERATGDDLRVEEGKRPPGWLQDFVRKPLSVAIKRLWDIEIEGLENVPIHGPVLLTPNHLSFIDSAFVMALAPRRTLAVGKGEYMDSLKTRYLFPALGMVPIDRSGGVAADTTLNRVADFLRSDASFLIYPEGTRSRDGFLHRGRTGAVRLALRTNAKIVPVGLIGTPAIQPIDTVMPHLGLSCTVRFGRPIDPVARIGREANRRDLRSLTDELMFEISELSEQQYVDTYGDEEP